MRILRYVSDLHLELRKTIAHPKLIPLWDFKRGVNDQYYLALLGDIGNPYQENLQHFLERVNHMYDKIFYVPGNHEYYDLSALSDLNLNRTKIDHRQKLQDICDRFNIILLDNNVYELDNFKIIGSTLWSHISDSNASDTQAALNDYTLIKHIDTNIVPITVPITNQWNSQAVDFITTHINNSDKPIIVLTHHAPLFSDVELKQYTSNPSYINNKYQEAFHNDLRRLIERPVVVWLYGHTHYTTKFQSNGVIIASNQLGYQSEETKIKFNPYAAILLDNLK